MYLVISLQWKQMNIEITSPNSEEESPWEIST